VVAAWVASSLSRLATAAEGLARGVALTTLLACCNDQARSHFQTWGAG